MRIGHHQHEEVKRANMKGAIAAAESEARALSASFQRNEIGT
jgi:hypothetical protein